jgi:hypothetical protein
VVTEWLVDTVDVLASPGGTEKTNDPHPVTRARSRALARARRVNE